MTSFNLHFAEQHILLITGFHKGFAGEGSTVTDGKGCIVSMHASELSWDL